MKKIGQRFRRQFTRNQTHLDCAREEALATVSVLDVQARLRGKLSTHGPLAKVYPILGI